MNKLIRAVLGIIGLGFICALLWWLLDYIGLPQPFDKAGHIAVAVLGVVGLCVIIANAVGWWKGIEP